MIAMIQNITEGMRKILSSIILVCLSLTAALCIFGYLMTNILIKPQLWINSLQDIKYTDQIRPFVSQLLISSYISGSNATFGEIPQSVNWDSIAQVIIPADWVSNNLNLLIHSISDWLLSPDASMPDYLVDLTGIKSNLRNQQSAVAILPLVEAVPECQESENQVVYLGGNLVSCRPKGWDLIYVSSQVLNTIADTLPDKISILTLASVSNNYHQIYQATNSMKIWYSIWQATLRFCLQIAIVLFCLYLLLNLKSMPHLARRLPSPFYGTGIILLLLFTGLYAFTKWGSRLLIYSFGNLISLENQSVFLDFVRMVWVQIRGGWLAWGVGLLFFAGVLNIAEIFLIKSIRHSAVEAESNSRRKAMIRKQFH